MIAHIHPVNGKIQSVYEHLVGTADLAMEMGKPLGMAHLAYLAGLFHDMGKFRRRYEEYLRNAVAQLETVHRGEVNHSSAGAIYLYRRYGQTGDKIDRLTVEMITNAILSHHGLNDCLSADGRDCFHGRINKWNDLDYEEVLDHFQNSGIKEAEMDQHFRQAKEEVQELLRKIKQAELRHKDFILGLIERMLLSIVIDADRLDTAVFCGEREIREAPEGDWEEWEKRLEKHLHGMDQEKPISKIRTGISEECLRAAQHSPGIYRLSVPTGGGKTLSSLRYALRHARTYGKKRIFYIGPYLSILEQNSQVFRTVFQDEQLVLEHHSNVLREEENSDSYQRYRHLTENWDHPFVVTTFVQFLNTLFSAGTQSVRRFHNLSDSVIVIDEIQSLPLKMIHMFNLTMNYLSALCGTTVVLCSATQPILHELGSFSLKMSYPLDMIADVDSLYQRLRRVKVTAKPEPMKTEELADFVWEQTKKRDSVLAILNTKASVSRIYERLKGYAEECQQEITLVHLSTNMCAEHRLQQIQEIHKLLEPDRKTGKKVYAGKVICVSTSLIEAGVDLSFETVIRSYAGLDSVVQAAGRCNRNGERNLGEVYLVNDTDERLGSMTEIKEAADCTRALTSDFAVHPEQYGEDLISPQALNHFYQKYYYGEKKEQERDYRCEEWGTSLRDLLERNPVGVQALREETGTNPDMFLCQAFKTAGKKFAVIDQNATGMLVPWGEGEELITEMSGTLSPEELPKLFRRMQRYMVNCYPNQMKKLNEAGALLPLLEGNVLALKEGFYDKQKGITGDGSMAFLEV